MIWRDVWDGAPNVVILAEDDVQQGVIVDALLFLGSGELPDDVTVSSPTGVRYRVALPEELGEDPRELVLPVEELSVEEIK